MKSILVQVSGTKSQDARVEAGLSIARAFDGHMTLCHPNPPDMVIGGLDAAATWTMASFEDYAAKVAKFRAKTKADLTEKMGKEDVSWDWRDVRGFTQEAFVSQTALTDLAIVTLLEDDFPYEKAEPFLSHVVTHSAAPVLALPADAVDFSPFGKALVAWDGSFEAAKALRQAIPILAKAEDVMLLSVGKITPNRFNLEEAAAYLARHDIQATTDEIASDGHVSDRLLETARAIDASYIVMGAYSHPRLMQLVLGGETRRMLKQSRLPVIFAH